MDFLRPHVSFFSNPIPLNPTFDGTPLCRVPSYNKMWPLTPIHCHLGTKIGQNDVFDEKWLILGVKMSVYPAYIGVLP